MKPYYLDILVLNSQVHGFQILNNWKKNTLILYITKTLQWE